MAASLFNTYASNHPGKERSKVPAPVVDAASQRTLSQELFRQKPAEPIIYAAIGNKDGGMTWFLGPLLLILSLLLGGIIIYKMKKQQEAAPHCWGNAPDEDGDPSQ